MSDPIARRPYMPGYDVEGGDSGLLPWSWATDRLTRSHDYWLATVRPDGRPHVMPVWGAWDGEHVRFSTAPRSRKARNLTADPRCTLTTDVAQEPVVVEGTAELVTDRAEVEAFTAASNAKYETGYAIDFYLENALFRVRPSTVFGLVEAEFTVSPTIWEL